MLKRRVNECCVGSDLVCGCSTAVLSTATPSSSWPSGTARSWAALGGVFVGVTAYATADVHFTRVGYLWLAIWYAFAVAEMVWVKKVVDSVSMSTWSRSFYQNALAVPPMALVALASPRERRLLLGAPTSDMADGMMRT